MILWNGGPSFWVWLDCDELFELFELSVNDHGQATVTATCVSDHTDSCDRCRVADVHVATDIDGHSLRIRA